MLRKKMRFIDEGGRALFHWGLCPLKTGLAAETISAIAGFGMFNLVRVLHDGFFFRRQFFAFPCFSTSIGAVQHLLPVFRPTLAPGHAESTDEALLGW